MTMSVVMDKGLIIRAVLHYPSFVRASGDILNRAQDEVSISSESAYTLPILPARSDVKGNH